MNQSTLRREQDEIQLTKSGHTQQFKIQINNADYIQQRQWYCKQLTLLSRMRFQWNRSIFLLLASFLLYCSHHADYGVDGFSVVRPVTHPPVSLSHLTNHHHHQCHQRMTSTMLRSGNEDASDDGGDDDIDDEARQKKEKEQEAVGNLVADDEWEGLTMELSEYIQRAVSEDLKANARDFLGKDDYKIGDICKEVDSRVKEGVADLRGKDEYELGDFVMAMDEMAKSTTEELTGKPYEIGDLSKEIDTRIKTTVAEFCGKEEYEFGDLSREISNRVQNRVEEFTGKSDYEFGDITKEIENRRRQWAATFLGSQEAADNYQFGDASINTRL